MVNEISFDELRTSGPLQLKCAATTLFFETERKRRKRYIDPKMSKSEAK